MVSDLAVFLEVESSMSMTEEARITELLVQLRTGEAAIEQLYKTHIEMLRSFVHSRCSPALKKQESPTAIASAVLQEILRGVAENRVNVQDRKMFRSLLMKAAADDVRDAARKLSTQARDTAREVESQEGELPDVKNDPAVVAALHEIALEKFRLIMSYSEPIHREMLLLSYVNHFSASDTRELLTASYDSVPSTRSINAFVKEAREAIDEALKKRFGESFDDE